MKVKSKAEGITPPHLFHQKNIFQKFEILTKIIWKYQNPLPPLHHMKDNNQLATNIEKGQITFMDKVIALIIPKEGSIFNSKELSSNEGTKVPTIKK